MVVHIAHLVQESNIVRLEILLMGLCWFGHFESALKRNEHNSLQTQRDPSANRQNIPGNYVHAQIHYRTKNTKDVHEFKYPHGDLLLWVIYQNQS